MCHIIPYLLYIHLFIVLLWEFTTLALDDSEVNAVRADCDSVTSCDKCHRILYHFNQFGRHGSQG
jgi:hypothetical protein